MARYSEGENIGLPFGNNNKNSLHTKGELLTHISVAYKDRRIELEGSF